MHRIIQDHFDELVALCKEFGVARLEAFGSVVTDQFDPLLSDIDFLVTFPPDYDYGPWMGRVFEFEERLKELFKRRVDLILAKEFRNPYFRRWVEESRRLLYAA